MFESYQHAEDSRRWFKAPPRTAFLAALSFAFLLGALCGEFVILVVREHLALVPWKIVEMTFQIGLAALFLFSSAWVVWRYLPAKTQVEPDTNSKEPRSGKIR